MNFTPGSTFSGIKPSGILWDMDGVLVDTADAHYQSWLDVLSPYGIKFDRDIFNMTFGMNNQSIIYKLFGKDLPDEEFATISDEKELAFRSVIKGKVTLLQGVHEWLACFYANKIPQAVASSAPFENIDAVLDETGIRSHFQAIVSAYGNPGKPDPWVFLEAGKRLGVDARTAIVIEDSPAGVLGAHHAGYHCIAVSSSLTPEESKTADFLVDRLDHVSIKDFERIISN
jgi:beta-phosphoglucomutase-like phosphatase (HAD superfamily)